MGGAAPGRKAGPGPVTPCTPAQKRPDFSPVEPAPFPRAATRPVPEPSAPPRPVRRAATLFALALALGLASLPPAAAQAPLRFGVVPQFEQRRLFSVWRPLLDAVQTATGVPLELVSTLSIPDFEARFLRGELDLAYMNPYHVLKANASQGYVPLVRDRSPLHGILVVHRDAPFREVAELDGRVIAFPSPNALGASLLLRADLTRLHGIRFTPLYAGTHSSVYLHVARGLEVAGGGVQKSLQEQPPEVRERLRVLYTTRAMPSHPIVAHPRLPPETREQIARAFLHLGRTEEGRRLLAGVPLPDPVRAAVEEHLAMAAWGLESFWVDAE